MRRRGPSPLARTLVVAAVLIVGLGVGWASTAANTMPGTNNASVTTIAATAASFKPATCTGSVTSIVNATGGAQTVNTSGALILGTSGADNITAGAGYMCFVGGGPTAANTDAFSGTNGAGQQCVIATSNPGNTIKKCTIVQSLP